MPLPARPGVSRRLTCRVSQCLDCLDRDSSVQRLPALGTSGETNQAPLLKLLQVKQRVVRTLGDANQFIQFDLNCCGVSILRVLNQEDNQERDDGGAGIDHELPSIAEPKYWTCDDPDSDDRYGEGEGSRTPAEMSGRLGESEIPGRGAHRMPVLTP